jgi:uncharacterized protein (DUF2147 family)
MPALLWIITTLLFTLNAYAVENDAILGIWTVQKDDARIEIAKAGDGTLEGKIVWLQNPVYPEGEADAGKPKRDKNNPDTSKQNDPLLGLKLLHGFVYTGDNLWKEGKIYDPKNGKTYSCKLTLTDAKTLEVRGFIGISLLGRTDVWTRFVDEAK